MPGRGRGHRSRRRLTVCRSSVTSGLTAARLFHRAAAAWVEGGSVAAEPRLAATVLLARWCCRPRGVRTAARGHDGLRAEHGRLSRRGRPHGRRRRAPEAEGREVADLMGVEAERAWALAAAAVRGSENVAMRRLRASWCRGGWLTPNWSRDYDTWFFAAECPTTRWLLARRPRRRPSGGVTRSVAAARESWGTAPDAAHVFMLEALARFDAVGPTHRSTEVAPVEPILVEGPDSGLETTLCWPCPKTLLCNVRRLDGIPAKWRTQKGRGHPAVSGCPGQGWCGVVPGEAGCFGGYPGLHVAEDGLGPPRPSGGLETATWALFRKTFARLARDAQVNIARAGDADDVNLTGLPLPLDAVRVAGRSGGARWWMPPLASFVPWEMASRLPM